MPSKSSRLIKDAGRTAVALPGDLREEAFCKKLVEDAIRSLGGLDIIVSNAGRQQTHESILDISSEDFDATMKTNIYAPFWIIKAALPHLRPGAVIIATTSEQAYDPSPQLYDYAQTKAATMNFVKSLAKQLGPKGIRVNGVAPGPIWTPLQVSGGATMDKLEQFGGHTPLGRAGQPAERRRSMYSLRRKMRAMPPGRFMVPRAAAANPSRQPIKGFGAAKSPGSDLYTALKTPVFGSQLMYSKYCAFESKTDTS